MLPKWSSSGQVSAKFSHESPASFCFLATGSVLLSLGPKMNSREGMSRYYVYCPAYVIKIACCSYMKLYPSVINRDFPLSSLNFAWYMLTSYFIWGLIHYFIPNKTPIRVWNWIPDISLISKKVMHSQINSNYEFVMIWVVVFCFCLSFLILKNSIQFLVLSFIFWQF